ncbi:MAG: class I SAM-dependent methyltransferase [Terriglobales bacterium]
MEHTPLALDAVAQALPELRQQYGEEKVRQQLSALEQHGDAVEDAMLWLRTALAHGFKFMSIERVAQCPCGSRDIHRLSRFVFWNLLGVSQCGHCGLLFVSPRLSQPSMRRIFDEFYIDPSQSDAWGRRRIPVFRDITRLLRRYQCARVFDVGTAFGHFLAWLTEAGFHAEGCEAAEPLVAWGRSHLGVRIHQGILRELDLPRGGFDCVVALDTFYYVDDPVAELAALSQLVPPGGHLILRLRNARGALNRARAESRKPVGRAIMPMEHLWYFTPATVQRLLGDSGWQVCLVEPSMYAGIPLALPAVAANRFVSARFGWPVLTHSFNIVAKRQV